MSHLNFNIRTTRQGARSRPFNPRASLSLNSMSLLWTSLSIFAVVIAAFGLVWFA